MRDAIILIFANKQDLPEGKIKDWQKATLKGVSTWYYMKYKLLVILVPGGWNHQGQEVFWGKKVLEVVEAIKVSGARSLNLII